MGMLIGAGLLLLFLVMALTVRWARRRSKGALMTGALLSLFAPDPELEKNIRLAEQARQVQNEEDEEGEKK
ncbi:MAG: hypothetical protein KJO33_08440 [Gammaproteobacteria bacterium]|nr:hypothetical protein [Gammaproteobacteria bacterium]